MIISSEQAVTMFARYCRARLGRAASQEVRKKAKALKRRGDIEGHEIWNEVAEEIDQAEPRRRPAH